MAESQPPPLKRSRLDEAGSSASSSSSSLSSSLSGTATSQLQQQQQHEGASASASTSSSASASASASSFASASASASASSPPPSSSSSSSSSIARLSGSGGAVLVLTADGKLFAGGQSRSGAMGLGQHVLDTGRDLHAVPLPPGVSGIADAVMGGPGDTDYAHTLAVGDDGVLYSVGNGRNGQLGWQDKKGTVNKFEWVKVKGALAKKGIVRSVGAGHRASLAVTVENKAYGWGLLGENGVPSRTNVLVPKVVQLPKTGGARSGPSPQVLFANSSTNGGGFALADTGLHFWRGVGMPELLDLPSELAEAGVASVARGSRFSYIMANNGTMWEHSSPSFGPEAGQHKWARVNFGPSTSALAIANNGGVLCAVMSDGSVWRHAGGDSIPTLICSPGVQENGDGVAPKFSHVAEARDRRYFLGDEHGEVWMTGEPALHGRNGIMILLDNGGALYRMDRVIFFRV